MKKTTEISDKEIKDCISTMQALLDNTDLIYEMPESERVSLMKVAGLLSRPDRDEFQQRKKGRKKSSEKKTKRKG